MFMTGVLCTVCGAQVYFNVEYYLLRVILQELYICIDCSILFYYT